MYCWVKELTSATATVATLRGAWVEYDTCLITAVKVNLTPRELLTANGCWATCSPGPGGALASQRDPTSG